MKRLHVHVGVSGLNRSIGFCSTLFGAGPSVLKPEHAKWMLDDPRVNFTISAGLHEERGIEHLGIQVEDRAELREVCSGSAGTLGGRDALLPCQIGKIWIAGQEGSAAAQAAADPRAHYRDTKR